MRRVVMVIAVALFASRAGAETADGIVAKHIQAVGGMEKIQAVKTLRRTGKFFGGGGFEAVYIQENERPNLVREDFVWQGMTGVNAYDGKSGWKISPWSGKKDPEPLGEEEMKSILEDSDFDGALVDYQKKKNRIDLAGMDQVEGTDVFKLKVTYPNRDVYYYYIDTDHYVPIKMDTKRIVRGAEREYETMLGDYKKVADWYLPHFYETNVKGSSDKSQVIYDKIEANVTIDADRFRAPILSASGSAKKP